MIESGVTMSRLWNWINQFLPLSKGEYREKTTDKDRMLQQFQEETSEKFSEIIRLILEQQNVMKQIVQKNSENHDVNQAEIKKLQMSCEKIEALLDIISGKNDDNLLKDPGHTERKENTWQHPWRLQPGLWHRKLWKTGYMRPEEK